MMPKQTEQAPEVTSAQRADLTRLVVQGFAVRGVQVFVFGLACYLAIAENRGWPCFGIGVILVVIIEAHLPVRPEWADAIRDAKKR